MRSYINLHHFKRYKKFIQSRNNTTGVIEKHHIFPKSIIPNNKLIALTPREHYIAHKILTKVFKQNTEYWHKMVKAFNLILQDNKVKNKHVNSRDFEISRIMLSNSMKLNNPMHNIITRNNVAISLKNYWTPERRKQQSEKMLGKPLPESAKIKLSKFWLGKPKTKTASQTENYIKSSACGIFITPWGEFYSPGQASRSEYNTSNLSRHLISKYCKNNEFDGFNYIPNGKIENRGHWKKKK